MADKAEPEVDLKLEIDKILKGGGVLEVTEDSEWKLMDVLEGYRDRLLGLDEYIEMENRTDAIAFELENIKGMAKAVLELVGKLETDIEEQREQSNQYWERLGNIFSYVRIAQMIKAGILEGKI